MTPNHEPSATWLPHVTAPLPHHVPCVPAVDPQAINAHHRPLEHLPTPTPSSPRLLHLLLLRHSIPCEAHFGGPMHGLQHHRLPRLQLLHGQELNGLIPAPGATPGPACRSHGWVGAKVRQRGRGSPTGRLNNCKPRGPCSHTTAPTSLRRCLLRLLSLLLLMLLPVLCD